MGAVEHREALRYVALPMELTVDRIPLEVGDAFDRVAEYMGQRGLAGGDAIIRYLAARPGGTFSMEVGHVLEAAPAAPAAPATAAAPAAEAPAAAAPLAVEAPFVAGESPAGPYSVAHHDGPYSRIGPVTKALMDSWAEDGVRPAIAHTTTGDHYASWYELYLDMPHETAEGLAGAADVCVLTR